MSLSVLIDALEMLWPDLHPKGDLQAFLESPANPSALAVMLNHESLAEMLRALVPCRVATFRGSGSVLELSFEDSRPGGRSGTLREFEERLLMLLSKGYTEQGRSGEVPTEELECEECLGILPSSSDSCSSCGSKRLSRAMIPRTIRFAHLEPAGDRNNEEMLDWAWEALTYLAETHSK